MIITGVGEGGKPEILKLSKEQVENLQGTPLKIILSRLENSLTDWQFERSLDPAQYGKVADNDFGKFLMALSSLLDYVKEHVQVDYDKTEFANFLNYLKQG